MTERAISSTWLPPKEAITYAREIIEREVERHKGLEKQTVGETNARWKRARFVLERLLGTDGCVVGAFDKRWLDDDFRKMWEKVRDAG